MHLIATSRMAKFKRLGMTSENSEAGWSGPSQAPIAFSGKSYPQPSEFSGGNESTLSIVHSCTVVWQSGSGFRRFHWDVCGIHQCQLCTGWHTVEIEEIVDLLQSVRGLWWWLAVPVRDIPQRSSCQVPPWCPDFPELHKWETDLSRVGSLPVGVP